jgi:hypothetical protein
VSEVVFNERISAISVIVKSEAQVVCKFHAVTDFRLTESRAGNPIGVGEHLRSGFDHESIIDTGEDVSPP